jgi:hypothetical protein
MMAHNKNSDGARYLTEKEVVGKSCQVDTLEVAFSQIEMFGVFGSLEHVDPKLLKKFVSQLRICNLIVILHDRIHF